MTSNLSANSDNQRSKPGLTQLSHLQIDSGPSLPDLNPGCAGWLQEDEGKPGSRYSSQNVPPSSGSVTEANENEEIVISSVQATDVILGLGRTPVGFYIAVHHSGLEWRTENKSLSIHSDAVEWGGPIPIPSSPTTIVCLEIYASYELQPMLGDGEQLRNLTVTVRQLLNHSAHDLPFVFSQADEGTISPCTSLLVTVKRHKRESNDYPLSSRIPEPHCSITETKSDLEEATDQGHKYISRFQEHKEKQDLEWSIKHFERALETCSLHDPRRAAAQSNLAWAKFTHSLEVDDSDIPLDASLALYRDALSARPVGHLDRPFTLIQLAAVHFELFQKLWNPDDASQAETLLHEVIDLSSAESYWNQTAAYMLQLYATRTTDPAQTGGPLSVENDSASSLTDVDPWILNVQLLHRFKRSADLGDLHEAISVLETALSSISIWDTRYLPGLSNLAIALLNRFHCLGKLSDLEKAISRFKDVAELTPDDDPEKPMVLVNLGDALHARFERFGEQSDIEQAISSFEGAVDLTPEEHPAKSIRLSQLGSCFKTRFRHSGELSDLEQAISRQGIAVDLAHDSHSTCLNNLGNTLVVRFSRLGEMNDLDEAISRHKEAVDLTPNDDPAKPTYLGNLGTSLFARFQRLGAQSDLKEAIARQWDSVNFAPDAHPDKHTHLNQLGSSLLNRFVHLEELSDLQQAISIQTDAVNLTSNASSDKAVCLNNLGKTLLTRFEYLGELSDLEHAISRLGEAVDNTSGDHSGKPVYLDDLGSAFIIRFVRFGDLNDLEQAISRQEKSISITPDDHIDKPTFLNNLGNSFCTRFERLGELRDLEKAISTYKHAVDLTPNDHAYKPACLNNLGDSFLTRFERLRELADLEQAIARIGDAIDHTLKLDGQPNKAAYIHNLSICLLSRFEHLGNVNDLEQAISKSRDAVNLTPDGHPNRLICLSHLGSALMARFGCDDEQSDLEEAISTLRDAVDLSPDGHIYKPHRLNGLGKSLLARFKHSGDLHDFNQAISMQGDAVELTPEGHSDKPKILSDLGDAFRIRFERFGEPNDLEQAISRYSHAACASVGPISDRFGASRQWIACARTLKHHSLLHAHSIAVDLLPQLAWIGLSLANRYRELVQGADVVREAAAAALDSGFPETAVEWLEQGRSIVWGELLRLRSSYDELSSTYPDHARRLQELSVALERAGSSREKSLSSQSETQEGGRETESLEQEANKHRMLAIERDKLLQEIRKLPGFGRFLLHKEFSQLRASAHTGPVVILNAAESRCDALIILAGVDTVIHVPLLNYTLERSKGFQTSLKNFLGPVRVIPRDDREGHPVLERTANQWATILSPLWKCVVKPVLDALACSIPGDMSRIFWCPTGPFAFLPIHAAGFYDSRHSQPGHKVSDFVVSSYVPTLDILASSLELDVTPKRDLHFLAVRQPLSDGLTRLPGVDLELEHIRTMFKNSLARTTLAETSVGTVEEVLDLMKDADWVHFACHGIQDARKPTKTGLCLADRRRLQLSDIIALSRPRGGLAFLSACQTAKGDEDLSDEAIHIAAGMLFAGYGGVIGTTWSISDKLAPHVVRDVYEQLFREGVCPDYRDAARALQNAVGRLRSSVGVSFVDWLPFIHVGL